MDERSTSDMEAALQQLDHEFEEGDLTRQGYEKRRSIVLSQFAMPQASPVVSQRGFGGSPLSTAGATAAAAAAGGGGEGGGGGALRIHSPRDSDHPAAIGSNNSLSGVPPRTLSLIRDGATYSDGSLRSRNSSMDFPVGQPQRLQEREGIRPSRRQSSLASYEASNFLPASHSHPSMGSSNGPSRSHTPLSQNYAFNPYASQAGNVDGNGGDTRRSTMLDSQEQYFSDFTGQQRDERQDGYEGMQRYPYVDSFSSGAQNITPLVQTTDLPPAQNSLHQEPLEPRDIPFNVCDPHNHNIEMSKFENIAMVLRHRAKTSAEQTAFWVLDAKGKDVASITWEKLASHAEKVAQVIRDKSSLYRGDRVALIYRGTEVVEFAVALLGCFIAGVVAVPINELKDYRRLNVILTSAQAHLALTTEANLKNFQRDFTAARLPWPRGVEWWKTNGFGSYHPKRKGEEPPVVVPDLAYIEFSQAPTGDLRGVVMSHRTIMHQMSCLSAIVSTAPLGNGDTFNPALRDKQGKSMSSGNRSETILSYLDPREGIGLTLPVLFNVYGGHTTIWLEAAAVETPGLYANLITKYRATLLVADYPRLKCAVYNYQSNPMATRNFRKGLEPNFSTVRLCLIDTLTVDPEFEELLADRWLRPLRNQRAREVVAPMLCLQEHGGMVISMRDWLGGEEHMGCSLLYGVDKHDSPATAKDDEDTSKARAGFGSSLIGGSATQPSKRHAQTDIREVLLDKEALKTNEVVICAIGLEASEKQHSHPNTIRCGAFGYPIPDATLAVVDPETSLLCRPNTIGEIWVDSPSLSGGFWALPKHTETIFHARPYQFRQGNPNPVPVEPEFLRTGLLGTVIEGKVFVLGLYEDRLRQRVEWVEHGLDTPEHRYFFVQHLISSIMRNVPKIHDCSAFDLCVNDEHLPIVLIESHAASTAPLANGGPPRQLDLALLDSLSERCIEVLLEEHHLRVYCVMITAPNTLPRITKNGRDEIGNMRCRREFDNGSLPCEHVKFGVERAVLNLPVGEDPVGGIWSPSSTAARQELLVRQEKQYSGVDPRAVVIDDRTSTPLNSFTSIFDLMQWRVARQAEELAYCSVDGRGREGKGLTWRKFDQRVSTVAMYLKNKAKVRPFDHVILMCTHSEEYVFAVYACLCLGAVAIPLAPLDQNRLAEDAPAFLHVVADMAVRCVVVNAEVDNLLKQKIVSQHLKQSANVLRINVPPIFNVAKASKQSHGCRHLGLTINPSWVAPSCPTIIWTYWTPDQRRVSVQLGHDTILGMCKVQKETCQMSSSRPVLGCVRSTTGLGFLYTCLMGVFMGAPTYLISPVDFAQNAQCLFVTLARYKVKDTYATSQMLEFAMNSMQARGFSLHELQNLMIATESRPQPEMYNRVRIHFAQAGLERTAINNIYSHVLNPMIASRSYMSTEPIELWLDVRALRRGLVRPVGKDNDPAALLVQDCGMVPVSTQIAIVNPETCQLCHVGEFGEIWVQSEACAKSFYLSKQEFDLERFDARIVGGDPDAAYVRTGDLGFLHLVHRPTGAGGQTVEMQVLFNLGGIGETFEVNGLSHFPMDIERSAEKCHRNIAPGGCAIFQAGGLVVIVVEVFRKAYLASMVPVIVGAILNEHQLVVDMISFVSHGDFPRSRLGEKQRGKILASWVTRKLRIVGQFGIRDPESANNPVHQIAEIPEQQQQQQRQRQPKMRGDDTGTVPNSATSRADLARTSTVSEFPSAYSSHPADTVARQDDHRQRQNGPAPPAMIAEHTVWSPASITQQSQSQSSYSSSAATESDRHLGDPPAVALNDRPCLVSEGRLAATTSVQNTHQNDGIEQHVASTGGQTQHSYQPYRPEYGSAPSPPSKAAWEQPQNDGPDEGANKRSMAYENVSNGADNDSYHEGRMDEISAAAAPRSSSLHSNAHNNFPSEDIEYAYQDYHNYTQALGVNDDNDEDHGGLQSPNVPGRSRFGPPHGSTSPQAPMTWQQQHPQSSRFPQQSEPDSLSSSSPSPPPPISKSSPSPYPPNSPPANGRATLPSQQQQRSRYSSYGSLPGLLTPTSANDVNSASRPPGISSFSTTAEAAASRNGMENDVDGRFNDSRTPSFVSSPSRRPRPWQRTNIGSAPDISRGFDSDGDQFGSQGDRDERTNWAQDRDMGQRKEYHQQETNENYLTRDRLLGTTGQADVEGRKSDVGSTTGSVRRRYDGSEYEGW